MPNELATPLLDLGIENPHFFEGRLLTAADLRADQEANRARQRQLGRAVGEGVAEGLWVELVSDGTGDTDPVVSISQGLAFNRKGQALEISKEKEEIALTTAPDTSSTDASLFQSCVPPSDQVIATGEGIWILVLSPASGFSEETAAMSALGTGKVGAGCGRRWAIEGVQLRLEALDPLTVSGLSDTARARLEALLAASDDDSLSRLRNVLAHLCLGTQQLAGFAANPFADPGTYGALDDLRAAERLTDCDVPLAILYWTSAGVRFLDNWSVRRHLTTAASSDDWPFLSGGRQEKEAQASLFQFQEHLEWLQSRVANPASVEVRDVFDLLPAAGLIPIQDNSSPSGFDGTTFFTGLATGSPTAIEGARLLPLLHESWQHGPADLTAPDTLQIHEINENVSLATTGPRQRYLLFTSGYEVVPDFFGDTLGDARTVIDLPSTHLNLGRVLDAAGATITPGLPALQSRLVIGQLPQPGSRVTPNSNVDLLLAAVPGGGGNGGPDPDPAPVIHGFSNVSTAIGDQVVILGENFDLTPGDNQVTFAGEPTTPTDQSTSGSLFVRIPEGIAGAPSAPGDSLSVEVRVVTDNGEATSSHVILPPLADPAPVIDDVDFSPFPSGVLGELLTINGQNFSETASENIVFFETSEVFPSTATTGQLTVRVPTSLPELPPGLPLAFINVIVQVNGVSSDAFQIMVQHPAA